MGKTGYTDSLLKLLELIKKHCKELLRLIKIEINIKILKKLIKSMDHQKIKKKLKSRKAVEKRFKKLKNNKFIRRKAFKGHLLEKKSQKRKHNLSKKPLVSQADTKVIRRILIY